jgi:hypothetical protein
MCLKRMNQATEESYSELAGAAKLTRPQPTLRLFRMGKNGGKRVLIAIG